MATNRGVPYNNYLYDFAPEALGGPQIQELPELEGPLPTTPQHFSSVYHDNTHNHNSITQVQSNPIYSIIQQQLHQQNQLLQRVLATRVEYVNSNPANISTISPASHIIQPPTRSDSYLQQMQPSHIQPQPQPAVHNQLPELTPENLETIINKYKETKKAKKAKEKEVEKEEKKKRKALEKEAREREAHEREAREKDTHEREAREREAREREAREREAREREAREKEAREREAREREAHKREAREREAHEREACKREDLDRRTKEEACKKEAHNKTTGRDKTAGRDKVAHNKTTGCNKAARQQEACKDEVDKNKDRDKAREKLNKRKADAEVILDSSDEEEEALQQLPKKGNFYISNL